VSVKSIWNCTSKLLTGSNFFGDLTSFEDIGGDNFLVSSEICLRLLSYGDLCIIIDLLPDYINWRGPES